LLVAVLLVCCLVAIEKKCHSGQSLGDVALKVAIPENGHLVLVAVYVAYSDRLICPGKRLIKQPN